MIAPVRRCILLLVPVLLLACDPAATTRPEASPRAEPSASELSPQRGISFVDVTESAGLGVVATPTWGSAFVEQDAGGYPSLLLNRHKRLARFYTSDAGVFTAVELPGLNEPAPGRPLYDRHNCAWGEANGDGRPDLYCTSGAEDGQGQGPNRLLIASQDGFADRTRAAGVADRLGRGRSVLWLDYDGDGDLDLFVANEIRPGFPNVLYRNAGGRFRKVPSEAAIEIATRSASWMDWDLDGDPDVLVLGHGFVGSRAFENAGGAFRPAVFPQVTGQEWLAASWGDIDNDGRPDLALVSEKRLLVLRNEKRRWSTLLDGRLSAGRMAQLLDADNDGDLDLFLVEGAQGDPPRPGATDHSDPFWLNEEGRLRRVDAPWLAALPEGNGESVAVADYDRDGRLDLFVTNGYLDVFGPPALLANRSAGGNWAALSLRGTPANPLGTGAVVKAVAGDLEMWRFVTDGVAGRAQSDVSYVHLGLGDAEQVSITVRWPDGTKDRVEAEAGSLRTVLIGSAAC